MTNDTRKSFKPHFRLRDLLGVVTIVCVLLAYFVPKIVASRETARRNACQAKQKELANAMLQYESAFRAFPPAATTWSAEPWRSVESANGQDFTGPNWASQLAGIMGNVPLARNIVRAADSAEALAGISDSSFGNKTPEYMTCPSAPVPFALHESSRTGFANLAKGNFAATLGSSVYMRSIEGTDRLCRDAYADNKAKAIRAALQHTQESRGIVTIYLMHGSYRNKKFYRSPAADNMNRGIWKFAHGRGTKLKDILDGTSHTVLLSEVLPYDAGKTASDDIRGVWCRASMGASTYSHATTPNSKVPDNINGCDAAATGLMKCIEVTRGTLQEGNTFAAARSSHSRGVNVVFADGSSKFFSNDVDPKIWKALATRDGGASKSKLDQD